MEMFGGEFTAFPTREEADDILGSLKRAPLKEGAKTTELGS